MRAVAPRPAAATASSDAVGARVEPSAERSAALGAGIAVRLARRSPQRPCSPCRKAPFIRHKTRAAPNRLTEAEPFPKGRGEAWPRQSSQASESDPRQLKFSVLINKEKRWLLEARIVGFAAPKTP